ncbi:hypothetical protein [Fimbriimonas ginsengisoli]|uniref:Uncharacterized protein n=1 Tax=Fimbriimonas ginsengisoli Gsoil 348 TaxID=661478 RepID=A0A068NSH3_FIMGI|nr:hypothetical protein [Fimbriimonas ginsengisoli]AIE86488.1 hypothetical protein OP10G_3120 [Fimbriimonas ginsengisoli Gsoil 348]
MNFVDATLIRIADPATRAAVFDQAALEQMAQAAYDADALALQGPYTAIFDQVTLGMSISTVGILEGTIRNQSGGMATDIHLQVAGLGPLLPARVDALWKGSVVARTMPSDGHITTVKVRFSVDDIDAEIVKDLGALPPDPADLETERRTRLIAEMRGAMAQPALLTDAAFDNWLSSIGASSVSDLVAHGKGSILPSVLQLQFSAPPDVAASPRQLPVAAAILIRDIGFSVAELLMQSKMLREQLSDRGIDVPKDRSLPAKNPFLVVWIVPITVFDDPSWPGAGGNQDALRADRRQKAGAWLGPEGIAIAGVSVA